MPASALVAAARAASGIAAGGRTLDVAYTPGHASHHVSYFSADAGIAFVGDTAGIRVAPDGAVVCRRRRRPTSTSKRGATASTASARWRPETLFVTHFGPWSRRRPRT